MQNEQNSFYNEQEPLPNAAIILALGITSIVLSFCTSVFGLICALLCLFVAKKDLDEYYLNPEKFTASSHSTVTAGKVCGIIGCVFSGWCLLDMWFDGFGKFFKIFF